MTNGEIRLRNTYTFALKWKIRESRLTLKLLAVGRATSDLQQAVYVVVEQTVAVQDRIQVDVVVFGRVLLVSQRADQHGEENNRDLDTGSPNRKAEVLYKVAFHRDKATKRREHQAPNQTLHQTRSPTERSPFSRFFFHSPVAKAKQRKLRRLWEIVVRVTRSITMGNQRGITRALSECFASCTLPRIRDQLPKIRFNIGDFENFFALPPAEELKHTARFHGSNGFWMRRPFELWSGETCCEFNRRN